MAEHESNSGISSAPVVSVAITAYNSAKWLARALDSVLAQQTSFPIEIVIGDDCSQDETVAVARGYQAKHPGLIHILEQPANVGIKRNYYETFEACRGRFIAWLDADDIWTDPDKLTAQVQVLESDPTVSVCAHFVRWITKDDDVVRDRYPALAPGRYGLDEIIRHDFVPSPSIMFRNHLHRSLPEGFFALSGSGDWPMLLTVDWPMLITAALSGDIILLDGIMADYRMTPGSSLTSKGPLYWHTIDVQCYEFMETILPPQWRRLVRAQKGKRYESLYYQLRMQGNYVASRDAAWKAFRSPFPMDNVGSKTKALIAAVAREAQWRLRGRPTAT